MDYREFLVSKQHCRYHKKFKIKLIKDQFSPLFKLYHNY